LTPEVKAIYAEAWRLVEELREDEIDVERAGVMLEALDTALECLRLQAEEREKSVETKEEVQSCAERRVSDR
jgi:MoxR-like ATPase